MKAKIIQSLVRTANILDKSGLSKCADIVEEILIRVAENSKLTTWTDTPANIVNPNSAGFLKSKDTMTPGQSFWSNSSALPDMPLKQPETPNWIWSITDPLKQSEAYNEWLNQYIVQHPEYANYRDYLSKYMMQQLYTANRQWGLPVDGLEEMYGTAQGGAMQQPSGVMPQF